MKPSAPMAKKNGAQVSAVPQIQTVDESLVRATALPKSGRLLTACLMPTTAGKAAMAIRSSRRSAGVFTYGTSGRPERCATDS